MSAPDTSAVHSLHFIGVGKMGLPMAGHLARTLAVQGGDGPDAEVGTRGAVRLTVSDTSAERCTLARGQGLTVVDDLAAALAGADLVFSSLPHDAALLAVAAQVAASARPGAVFVDTSTVSARTSAEVAALCERAGVAHLRVAVSGNNKMAEAAMLTVLASGPREIYDRLAPLLRALGPQQFWLGPSEQARAMKLVVNLMIAQTSAMLAEALTLGRAGGLDWHDMWQVLAASAVGSPIVKAKGAMLAERDFSPTFTVHQMIKDVDLILGAGAAAHVALPQTGLTLQALHAAVAQGDGELDYAAIIRAAERAAGLPTELG
jgi:3-hydroxyisobutyrate dehydrogenase